VKGQNITCNTTIIDSDTPVSVSTEQCFIINQKGNTPKNPMISARFRYRRDNALIVQWMKKQQNINASMLTLINQHIAEHGVTDALYTQPSRQRHVEAAEFAKVLQQAANMLTAATEIRRVS